MVKMLDHCVSRSTRIKRHILPLVQNSRFSFYSNGISDTDYDYIDCDSDSDSDSDSGCSWSSSNSDSNSDDENGRMLEEKYSDPFDFDLSTEPREEQIKRRHILPWTNSNFNSEPSSCSLSTAPPSPSHSNIQSRNRKVKTRRLRFTPVTTPRRKKYRAASEQTQTLPSHQIISPSPAAPLNTVVATTHNVEQEEQKSIESMQAVEAIVLQSTPSPPVVPLRNARQSHAARVRRLYNEASYMHLLSRQKEKVQSAIREFTIQHYASSSSFSFPDCLHPCPPSALLSLPRLHLSPSHLRTSSSSFSSYEESCSARSCGLCEQEFGVGEDGDGVGEGESGVVVLRECWHAVGHAVCVGEWMKAIDRCWQCGRMIQFSWNHGNSHNHSSRERWSYIRSQAARHLSSTSTSHNTCSRQRPVPKPVFPSTSYRTPLISRASSPLPMPLVLTPQIKTSSSSSPPTRIPLTFATSAITSKSYHFLKPDHRQTEKSEDSETDAKPMLPDEAEQPHHDSSGIVKIEPTRFPAIHPLSPTFIQSTCTPRTPAQTDFYWRRNSEGCESWRRLETERGSGWSHFDEDEYANDYYLDFPIDFVPIRKQENEEMDGKTNEDERKEVRNASSTNSDRSCSNSPATPNLFVQAADRKLRAYSDY